MLDTVEAKAMIDEKIKERARYAAKYRVKYRRGGCSIDLNVHPTRSSPCFQVLAPVVVVVVVADASNIQPLLPSVLHTTRVNKSSTITGKTKLTMSIQRIHPRK